jgi:hypothetical protein
LSTGVGACADAGAGVCAEIFAEKVAISAHAIAPAAQWFRITQRYRNAH